MKQRMSNRKFRRIWIPIISVIAGLCLLATIAMNVLSDFMKDYLGHGDYVIHNEGEAVSDY